MYKFIAFIKRWQTAIKLIFFMSVAVLVVNEFSSLFQNISIVKVFEQFNQLNIFSIILIISLGLISCIPMLVYDVVLNKELGNNNSLKYIIETSWIINSFNNVIGFLGLVDIGLRYSFYAVDDNSEDSLKKIKKFSPYFAIGLSLLSILALIILYLKQNYDSVKYWPILIIITIYFPILIVRYIRENKLLGQIKNSTVYSLVTISFFDWSILIGGFILIGCLLGIKLPLITILPLIIVGHVFGMLSMIPGGLGSFDLVLLAGLSSLGVQTLDIMLWLLLFRMSFYLVPFLIGIFFFIKHMGSRINNKYFGLPRKLIIVFLEQTQVFLLRLFGFFFILSSLIPDEIQELPLLRDINPVRVQILWQYPSVILGGLFILLARLITNRLRNAIKFSYILFITTIIYINWLSITWFTTAILLVIFILIYLMKGQLTRKSFYYSWESFTKDGLLFASTVFILVVLIEDSIILSIKNIKTTNFIYYFEVWLYIAMLAALSLFIYKAVIWSVSRTKPEVGEIFNQERYTELVKRYEVRSEAALAYLADKRLFWYQVDNEDYVVLQFSIYQNKCIVMSDPIGDKKHYNLALESFVKECRQNNLKAIFYEVSQEITLILHELGYEFIKFGESAKVDLKNFTLEGKAGKKYRTVLNKLENNGFSFEVSHGPHSEELLDSLELISNNWLNGRTEKGFSLGFFDREYLQLAPVALVRDEQGEIFAFVNFLPVNNKEIASIDLMRYKLDDVPNGLMDYLFIKLLQHFKNENITYFDLGMAPLANVGNMENSFIQEKLAYFIYLFSNRFYSFGGVHQYKQKFNPIWEAKYIAYPKHNWLLYDMISIYQVSNKSCSEKYY